MAEFTALNSTLDKFMPFSVTAPLDKRDDRQLDIFMNQANLLKLSTTQPLVFHLGNQLSSSWKKVAAEYSDIKYIFEGIRSLFLYL